METLQLVLVPDPEHPDSVEVYADGTVDDQPVRFLVDTGGATSSVPPGLGVPCATERESRGAGGGLVDATSVRVGHLRCGPYEAHDLVCGVATSGPALLGLDVLAGAPVTIRLAEGSIVRGGPHPPGQAWPLATPPDGRPHWYVTVDVGADATARGVLDTGASLTVVDRAFCDRQPEFVRLTGAADAGQDASGASVDAALATLAACRIGGVDFPATAAVVVDLSGMNAHLAWPIDLIIGVPLLRLATWHVDAPGRSWSVTAAPRES